MANDLTSANLIENLELLSLEVGELGLAKIKQLVDKIGEEVRQRAGITQNVDETENTPSIRDTTINVTQDLSSFEYGMDNKHRGLAIIFNHLHFNNDLLETRYGTGKDVTALQECLPYLGFQKDHIIVEHNLTKPEILDYVNKLKKDKGDILKNGDCLAIFILTHGSQGNLISAADNEYDLYTLVEQYTSNNLEQLVAKPKLFFVQTCRGKTLDSGTWQKNKKSSISGDSTDGSGWVREIRPSNSDILISHSSYHDHSSFRNIDGSWYIQDVCNAIRKYHMDGLLHTTDVTELLTYTNFLVSQRESIGEYQGNKQCPTFNSGLSRKLYFKQCKIST